MRAGGALLILLLAAAGRLAAQADCFPPADSHEAQVFGILSVPIAFSAAGPPEQLAPGRFQVGLEASYLPRVDRTTATPTICRPGKGPEHVNLLPGFLRPRLAAGLPGGFEVEVAWVPPVRVREVEANLVSLAVARALARGRLGLALRAHATFGVVHAPVTCDDAALQDPASECFGGTRSNDSFHPNILGIELQASQRMNGRLALFGAVGYNRLQPRFRVNFTNQFGTTDRRRVSVDLDRLALSAGVLLRLGAGFGLVSELYAVPADAVTGRLVVRRQLGGSP